jgi:hypothetical protein
MPPSTGIERLDAIADDHPCLWGDLSVREDTGKGLQSWSDATVLPTSGRRGEKLWWRRYSYGVFDAAGRHLRTLSDMRGERHFCHPRPRLVDNPFNTDRLEKHDVVLYGGTLYAAFGHLILDSGRAYQLLREHRSSDLPIWFHDATPHRHPGSILKLGLVQAWLKQQKDPTNFGSGGVGSIGHIVGEIYANASGTKLQHIGYKGSAPMHTDLIGGTIKLAVDSLPQNIPFFRSGQLRGLATAGPKRTTQTPDLPTMAESALPGFQSTGWVGLMVPRGTPRPITDRLYTTVVTAMKQPETQELMLRAGADPASSTPAEFAALIRDEWNRFKAAIAAAKLSIE